MLPGRRSPIREWEMPHTGGHVANREAPLEREYAMQYTMGSMGIMHGAYQGRHRQPRPGQCICGVTQNVTFGPDPFMSEVHGDTTEVWLCEGCRYQRRMDV